MRAISILGVMVSVILLSGILGVISFENAEAAKKPKEIVVVGSKVKDVVRDAKLAICDINFLDDTGTSLLRISVEDKGGKVKSDVPDGAAIVVYGGGTPSCSFPPNVISDVASSGSLGLGNSFDILTLQDPSGSVIDEHTWNGGGADTSIVRSPEFIQGAPFVDHFIVSGLDYSPGTDVFGNMISIP